jgi:hypothetical protein
MFKALLDLIGAAFGAATHIGGKMITIVIVAIVCLGAWLLQTIRLGCWSGPASTIAWLAFLWFLVWIFSSALTISPGIKLASGLLVVVGFLIGSHTIISLAPGTAKGVVLVAAHQDQKNFKSAVAATVNIIKPFECNKTNASSISYYGQDDSGQTIPIIWYARDRAKRHVICFRENGVYDQTGKPVEAVTPTIIEEIAMQEPLAPPPQLVVAAATPQPTPIPTPYQSPSPIPTPEPIQRVLPAGTTFNVLFMEPLDVDQLREGQVITASLNTPVRDDNGVDMILPGSQVSLEIQEIKQKFLGTNRYIRFKIIQLTTPRMQKLSVHGEHSGPIQIRPYGLTNRHILPPGILQVRLEEEVVI